MMSLQKIADKLLAAAGVRKRNGFPKGWESPQASSSRKKNRQTKVNLLIARLSKYISLPRKRRSFVSRTEKRQKLLRQVVRTVSTVCAVFAFFLVAKGPTLHYVAKLDLFKVKDISISGQQQSTAKEIKLLGEFDYKTSLIKIVPDVVQGRIEAHPWVHSASVKRVWPDGLAIKIREHSPAALLVKGDAGEEKTFFLSGSGEVIAPVKVGDDIDYPVVTGLENIDQDQRAVLLAEVSLFLKLISRNNPNLPAQSVSEIHLDRLEGLVIRLVEFPFPIYFGRGEVNKKYKQLRRVLAVLYNKRKKNVDLSEVEYIRMDYLNNKVLVAQSESG